LNIAWPRARVVIISGAVDAPCVAYPKMLAGVMGDGAEAVLLVSAWLVAVTVT